MSTFTNSNYLRFMPRTGVKKKKKKGKLTLLKNELWQLVRLKVFATYGSDCYTCDAKNLEGVNRQGGHVPWHSSELSVPCRYDIRFIRAQCFNCNMRKGGKGGTANQRMRAEGIDVDGLWRYNLATKGKVYPLSWFENKIKELS